MWGATDPVTLEVMRAAANADLSAESNDKALELFNKLRDVYQTSSGVATGELVRAYMKCERFTEAVELSESTLESSHEAANIDKALLTKAARLAVDANIAAGDTERATTITN